MTARLTEKFTLAGRTAPSRVLFGPHETNLGEGRALSARHVAYYERRARGGAGLIVTENASVHSSDHPYERAPLASECGQGWRAISTACRPHGALVLAGLTHHGLQGSTAYSRAPLWGPSRVADVQTREMPMVMERDEIDALVAGFAASAGAAMDAGLDGVEIDAGPRSLLRQFLSGLTNERTDDYGSDRSRLCREVLTAVRASVGGGLLSLRLSCDELAPWAGITPDAAQTYARELSQWLDLIVVVRGGPMSTHSYRPDFHERSNVNAELCGRVRAAVTGEVALALQGSVTEPEAAQAALDNGTADVVEMTRAQIADPELVNTVRRGSSPKPCVRCNQACLVRHPRNPVVSCVVTPDTGYEQDEVAVADERGGRALVVGAGPAGLEAARVLALRGIAVTVAERSAHVGGMVRVAAVATPALLRITDHLESECRRLGVDIRTGTEVTHDNVDGLAGGGAVVVAIGSRPRPQNFPVRGVCVDVAALLAGMPVPDGPVVVHDPVGGPVAIAAAEWLHASGASVSVVTPDSVLGRDLGPTGDLVGANVRAQRRRIVRHLGTSIVGLDGQDLHIADRYTGVRRVVPCAVLVDCSHRLPDRSLELPGVVRVGDCVAPRTILEAIREGGHAARSTGTFDSGILTSQEN